MLFDSRSDFRQACVLWITLLLFASLALAQNDTSRLEGKVTDPTGAVVPDVTVQVVSKATAQEFKATSGADGTFAISALPVGEYTITATAQGFKTYTQDVRVDAGIVASAAIGLEPGAVTETVEVSEQAGLVEATSSSIAATIQGKQITDLPINGRNFTQLATLVPGVTRGNPNGIQSGTQGNAETFRYGNVGGSSLVVNGLRPQANNFILDGADNNESLVNTVVFFPPADAIQEFTVQTNIAPAEFGRAGGAIVNTVIRSGTNDIHGSAFWFLRNSALDARPTFAPTKTEFRRHQFGGTLGFPIVKNKLFVFGDFSGLRQFFPVSLDHVTVPTMLMRSGNFSELLNPAVSGLSAPIVIRDVMTGLPYSGNVIPPGQINKVGQTYLNAFPLPNLPGVEQNYITTRNQIQDFRDWDIRVDYLLNEKNQIFGRFSYGDDSSLTTSDFPTLPAGFGSGSNFNQPRGIVVGETHTFSATVVNELRLAYTREFFGYNPPFGNIPLSKNLGIPNANTSPELGGGALIGGYGSQISYTGDYGAYLVPQNSYQLADSVSLIKGTHTLKFGTNLIWRQVNLFRPIAGKGYFFLCGNGTDSGDGCAAGSTGFESADILAGFLDQYQIGAQTGYFGTRSWENGVYGQDDWRVSPRLTLNLGLRYDVLTWPREQFGRQTNFDLATGALITPAQAGSFGLPPSLVKTDWNNVAPRVGFAYDLTGKGTTVMRGGFGTFYFIDRGGISNQLAQNQPYSGEQVYGYTQGYRFSLSGEAPIGTNDPTLTTGPLPPAGIAPGFSFTNPKNIGVVAALFNNRNSYVNEYNFQIQHQLPGNSVFRVGYVGTEGHKLTTYYDANQQFFNAPSGSKLYPNLGSVIVQANIGNSVYNSLQAEFERRLTNGFQFRASFTWSSSIDDSPGAFDASLPQDSRNLSLERARSVYDQPYVFVFSSLYELPFGRGKQFGNGWSKPVDLIFGGWQLNGILTAFDGLPFSVYVNGSERADVVGPVQIFGTTEEYFNKAAFSAPPQTPGGVYIGPGTSGRDLLRGPGWVTLDLSVFKAFAIYERTKLEFRSEFYNIANHPRFQNPDGSFFDSTFAVINNTVPGSERQIEFALRLTF
ncbi:MAG: TonB-dependent receptor [Acidobacteriaceae bacterium]|nr:TonB-dependent receptor [Acidobacteriaceae bacterium]MBV9779198.1 TonB-dependent receptor [Acidobacteriaceae bacterium]